MRLYCNCHGVIHPLLTTNNAPSFCNNCGNIPCEQQGAGPCLFCGFEKFDLKEAKNGPNCEFSTFKQSFGAENELLKISKNLNFPEEIDRATQQFREIVYGNLQEIDMDRAIQDDQIYYFDGEESEGEGR